MVPDDTPSRTRTVPVERGRIARLTAELRAFLICAGHGFAGEAEPLSLFPIDRQVAIGRATETGPPEDPEAALLADALISRQHAEITRTGQFDFVIRDLGSLNGTIVNGRRIDHPVELQPGATIAVGRTMLVFRLCDPAELRALKQDHLAPFGPVPTMSPAMALLKQKLRRLAPSDLDLLMVGETGVGKEVYARAVHHESGRPGAFTAINCAALPETLIESELYGYARGAHSTAGVAKPGLIERAHRGTLFLDEIAEMPSAAQAKLLRFLQTRSFMPLGSTRPIELDVRVIAATNRAVDGFYTGSSTLRPDLEARLGPEPLRIPALRDRIEDVGALLSYFLRGRPLDFEPGAYRAFYQYSWPGNVRELEKVAALLAALADEDGGPVTLDQLPDTMVRPHGERRAVVERRPGAFRPPARPAPSVGELERLLEEHDGDVASVARTLGRQRTLVWRWLRKSHVDPHQYRRKMPDSGDT